MREIEVGMRYDLKNPPAFFGLDEVSRNVAMGKSVFTDAVVLVLEGFAPNSVPAAGPSLSGTFTTAWGACNEDLYQRAFAEMAALSWKEKPFFATLLSVSNHRPYT